jgi:hypothetical protein
MPSEQKRGGDGSSPCTGGFRLLSTDLSQIWAPKARDHVALNGCWWASFLPWLGLLLSLKVGSWTTWATKRNFSAPQVHVLQEGLPVFEGRSRAGVGGEATEKSGDAPEQAKGMTHTRQCHPMCPSKTCCRPQVPGTSSPHQDLSRWCGVTCSLTTPQAAALMWCSVHAPSSSSTLDRYNPGACVCLLSLL